MHELEIMRCVAYCPHCGNDAPQRHIATHSRVRSVDDATYYTMVVCETCDHAAVYREARRERQQLDMRSMLGASSWSLDQKEIVWPDSNKLHSSIPDAVRTCYEEAAAIKARAPNAFANQIRRALEALCKDRGSTKKILAQNLKELCDRGELPPPLGMMTDILRMLGNKGSHASDDPVEPEYVDAIDEFFRAVVEYVYVAPHRVNEVQARLDYAKKLRSGGK